MYQVTIPLVPADVVAHSRPCIAAVLILAGLGLLAGLGTSVGPYWGMRNVNPVLAARYYSERPANRGRLPGFARGIFLAVVFSGIPFVKGWCPGFLRQHLPFAICLLGCGFSSGAWLLVASVLRQNIDSERTARIEQFISDPAAQVPARVVDLDTPPRWLRLWNWSNIALFVLLIGQLTASVL